MPLPSEESMVPPGVSFNRLQPNPRACILLSDSAFTSLTFPSFLPPVSPSAGLLLAPVWLSDCSGSRAEPMPATPCQEAPPCLTLGLPADLSPQLPPLCVLPGNPSATTGRCCQPQLSPRGPPRHHPKRQLTLVPLPRGILAPTLRAQGAAAPWGPRRASHRRVPTGWLISPHFTDGELWPQEQRRGLSQGRNHSSSPPPARRGFVIGHAVCTF